MLQKTFIATLLALLSGIPLLKAQTLDTTSADTLISITDSLVWKIVDDIKTDNKIQNTVIAIELFITITILLTFMFN